VGRQWYDLQQPEWQGWPPARMDLRQSRLAGLLAGVDSGWKATVGCWAFPRLCGPCAPCRIVAQRPAACRALTPPAAGYPPTPRLGTHKTRWPGC